MKDTKKDIEDLKADNQRLYEDAIIKDSIILEYQQALGQAQFAQARLNGTLKVRERQIAELKQALDPEPTA